MVITADGVVGSGSGGRGDCRRGSVGGGEGGEGEERWLMIGEAGEAVAWSAAAAVAVVMAGARALAAVKVEEGRLKVGDVGEAVA